MIETVKKHISLKLTLTLLVCLVLIFSATSWVLIHNRQQVLEQELLAKGRLAALSGAQALSHFLEELLDSGIFSEAELFDENYCEITSGPLAGAAIPKYHTAYDHYLDAKIQHILDAYLSDDMVVFAVLVDRNGYLPTHNRRYSKPLTGDHDRDRVGNRTKRIFNDPVGLAAATYHEVGEGSVLKQVYPRDTGVLMWDLSAPVTVRGKHWGGFRIGFSMEKTEASVNHLRWTVAGASVSALLLCSLLTMLIVSRTTRPLLRLTQLVQAVGSGQRREKLDLQSSDEIGVLVAAFNQMLDSLEETTVSRDFYDMLLQSMHDLLIVTAPDGKILSVNRATCDVLGYSESHVMSHHVQELVQLRENLDQDWFSEQLGDLQNYTADVDLVNCSEAHFPMAMSCSPLRENEQLSGFIFTFQDNRQRIEAEAAKKAAYAKASRLNAELLQTNADMETKNEELAEAYRQLKNSQVQILQQEKMASIGQLAAGVAHEINNPMGFITSNLGSLGKYLERLEQFIEAQGGLIHEQATDEQREELKTLRKKLKIDYLLEDSRDLVDESLDGANRVKIIVQNLKTFSRLDQDQEQEADLNECLEDTISIAWNELKYKVTLEKEFADLPLLKCFPQKLNQVFLNLLVNGAQAIEDKGTIKIRTWFEQEDIFINISDDGCGIAEENLTRIFEPFFTTKEVGRGTGLGMSISYEIIKEHGGELTVSSVVGEGTSFIIRLPLKCVA